MIARQAGGILDFKSAKVAKGKGSVARIYFAATGSRFWRACADYDPMIIAILLPWSTSFVVFVLILWLFAIFPRLDTSFLTTLRHPVSLSALALVGIATLGVLWGEGPWWPRLLAIGPVAKLLFLPLLLFHYQRSARAHWVLWGFIGSCSALMLYSFALYFFPELRLVSVSAFYNEGIPVRNAIDQNQEFAFCAFAILLFAIEAFRRGRARLGLTLIALASLFFINIFFIALARTSVIYIAALGLILAARLLPLKAAALAAVILVAGMATVWEASPYLRGRILHIAVEYQEFRDNNQPTSTGLRLQYWNSAIRWTAEKPVLGHGTGAARRLYDEAAEGKEGAWGHKIGNPHNQLLFVSIEWGFIGCVLLLLMWWRHYAHFREEGIVALIGAIIVTQNVFSSLFNSHIFDFTEGWMYVFGVGVAGGAIMRKHRKERAFGCGSR